MKEILVYLIIVFVITLASYSSESAEKQTVEQYVSHFLRIYPERNDRAQNLIPKIKKLSKKNGIDYRIVVVMVTMESAWRTDAVGTIGEIGLMQIHGVCRMGHDLSTPLGQIKAGIMCLRLSRDACDGSDEQMVAMYASGNCKSESVRTQRLVRRRLAIARKLKGGLQNE